MDVVIEVTEITANADIQETVVNCDVVIGGGGGGTTDYNVLNNKPQINSVELSGNKTSSDLGLQPLGNYATKTELDTKVDKVTGKVLSTNDYTTDDKNKLAAITGTNTGDQYLGDLQPKTDASLETDSTTIVGAINEVNSVAKGANKALSFIDYKDVISKMSVTGLNVGQNLYIEELNVPDLWIKTIEVTNVSYTYVSDAQFVNDILAGVQIGYYQLSILETQKVDLTNYYTKQEINNNFRNETQATIGTLIEITELTSISDTTKIAASDNSFLKWFSGLRIYTYLKSKFDSVYQAIGNYATGGGTATGTNTGDEISVGTTTPTGNEDLWIDPTAPEITTADIQAVSGYRYLNESQYNGVWSTGIQVGNNTDTASSSNVGRIRYRTSGNNSYFEMCMQTSASTYDWKIIYQNNW
jgi:hypothetical protein